MTELFATVKGILIRDVTGNNMFSRMYDDSLDMKKFEDRLFAKSRLPRIKDDLFQLDQTLVVHKFSNELHFYVIGQANESPLSLDKVLQCLVEVVSLILSKNSAKESFVDKRAQILSSLEEICHNAIFLESDGALIMDNLRSRDNMPEQTMTQRLQSATETFKFSWIRS